MFFLAFVKIKPHDKLPHSVFECGGNWVFFVAGIHPLGHESQDLYDLRDNACKYGLGFGSYSHPDKLKRTGDVLTCSASLPAATGFSLISPPPPPPTPSVLSLSLSHTHTPNHPSPPPTSPHTHTHADTHMHAPKQIGTQTYTQTQTHTYKHTHSLFLSHKKEEKEVWYWRDCTRGRDWLAGLNSLVELDFSPSLLPPPPPPLSLSHTPTQPSSQPHTYTTHMYKHTQTHTNKHTQSLSLFRYVILH